MKRIISLISIMILLVIPVKGYSKTFAYLFTKDEIIKLDTETDSIITRTKSPTRIRGSLYLKYAGCAVDINNKYFITLSKQGGETDSPGFYVYDLQTLNQVKFVAFPEIVKESILMKIIYPQIGTKFYIQIDYINNEQDGFVNLAYDKKTFNYIGSINSILNELREDFWFSEAQDKIYIDTVESNIRIHDSQTLSVLNTIDLSNIYAKNLWGKGIIDIKNGIVLLGENNKLQKTDKNNMSFLAYKIADSSTSPRVITGMDDKMILLTPDSNKVIFNEAKAITSSPDQKAPKKGASATGRLHIYDVKTGNKLGLIFVLSDCPQCLSCYFFELISKKSVII